MAAPLLPILEPESGPKLVGIARLAAEGEHLRDGHEVEFFTLDSRSILNRCNVPRMPFTWTINPYRGCEFACKYCYARYTHEFMELRDNVEFERKIFVKQHAADLLRHDLRKVKAGETIAIGTATDPFQPAERRYEVTRSILEEFAKRSGYDIGIVTKSTLIVRDIDVLRRVGERNSLYVNLTITTLDINLARILEPRAPRPDLRLEVVRRLNENGVAAGVIIAPVLPSITDGPGALEAIVRATAEAGGRYVYANPLFLKPCSASIFLPFVREHFPALVNEYEQRFRTNAFLPDAYRKRISQLMAALRKKYGMAAREEFTAAAQTVKLQGEQQLSLF
jgi:DNA repair photolyase